MENPKDVKVMQMGLIDDVNWEIDRGTEKWGCMDKDPPALIIAITEELGEATHAINHNEGSDIVQQEIVETIGLLVRLYYMVAS